MSIGKRIRQLRRSLDLTQKEFAERMGVKQNTIATYETERSVPIDAVISLICREFNVSEAWLRTGEGEMFAAQSREETLSAAVNTLLSGEPPEWRQRLVVALARFSPSDWDRLERELRFILDGEVSDRPAAQTVRAMPSADEHEETPEERHERHKREARAEADELYEVILKEKMEQDDPETTFGSNSYGGGVA